MKFRIKDKRVILIDRTMRLVGDNEYEFEFEFDEEWTGKVKTARFILGDYKLDIVLDNDKCTLDKTFFKGGQLIVGVYSSNVATEVLKHQVKPSILEEDGTEPTVPEDLWTQLLEIVETDVQYVRQAVSDAEQYVQNAEEAVSGFGDVVQLKTAEFNTNAAEKQTEYNQNAANKIREYDEHITDYTAEIDLLKDDLVDLTKSENISYTQFENTGCSGRGIYGQNNQTVKMFTVEEGSEYLIIASSDTKAGFSTTLYGEEYATSGLVLTDLGTVNRTRYTCKANGYIYVSSTGKSVSCYKIDTTVDELVKLTESIKDALKSNSLFLFDLEWEQGKFVNSSNGNIESASKYYYATNYIDVVGNCDVIVYTRSTNDLSGIAFYDKEHNYISGQPTYDADWKEWKISVPKNASYFRYTGYTYKPSVNISVSYARYDNVYLHIGSLIDNSNTLNEKTKNIVTYDLYPFERIGIVGDSLASGCSNYYDESGNLKGVDIPKYSWGKYLSRTYGIDVDLYSKGGANTRTWLSSDFGLLSLQSAELVKHITLDLAIMIIIRLANHILVQYLM